jgi:hypothetical protein
LDIIGSGNYTKIKPGWYSDNYTINMNIFSALGISLWWTVNIWMSYVVRRIWVTYSKPEYNCPPLIWPRVVKGQMTKGNFRLKIFLLLYEMIWYPCGILPQEAQEWKYIREAWERGSYSTNRPTMFVLLSGFQIINN